jgi:hypothetical protein
MDAAHNSASNGTVDNEEGTKKIEQDPAVSEKRIGCAHYKRRAKFVVRVQDQ